MSVQGVDNATPLPPDINNQEKKIVDKQRNTTMDPRGINGFVTHPENINRNGRPPRKTLVEMVQDELDKQPNGEQNIAKLIINLMFNKKDRQILDAYWKHRDGMPRQSTDLTTGGKPLPTPIYGNKSSETV